MDIHQRIRDMRSANKISLRDLSKMVGLSHQTLQKYESGEIKNIPLESISKLAKVFGCTEDYLAGWSDKKDSAADFDNTINDTIFSKLSRLNSDELARVYAYIQALLDSHSN